MPALRATMSRSVLVKIDQYRTFRPLEIVFYSTCRIGTERSAVQTFRFHLARRRRMPAPAKSKAVATVKLNEIKDVKESLPASQGPQSLVPTYFIENGARHPWTRLVSSSGAECDKVFTVKPWLRAQSGCQRGPGCGADR